MYYNLTYHITRKIFLIYAFGLLLLSLQSCGEEEIVEIKHGSKFGMCIGYCYSEVIITEKKVVAFSKARTDTTTYPIKKTVTPMKQTDWEAIKNIIVRDDFFALEEIIGCPDCADGGESWVYIKTNTKTHKVRYEYGNAPKPLKALVELIEKHVPAIGK